MRWWARPGGGSSGGSSSSGSSGSASVGSIGHGGLRLIGVVGSLGFAVAGCHGPAPANAGSPAAASAATASCKVSQPVCDPTIGDDTAVALVRQRCAGCHDEGGKAEHPLLEPAALFPERNDVALRLSGREMPPDDTPLPPAERRQLIGWGACARPPAAAK